ncbi:hypothetical protein KY285_016068 [Solanum tuberosum]|nr:hypothetical protein KY285_016068 [Solanum tuberosum]
MGLFVIRVIMSHKSQLQRHFVANRLSTDDQVEKLGINNELGCYCCVNIPDNNSLETADHLLCKRNLAKIIWRSIAYSLGVRLIQNSLKLLLLNWWNTHTNNPIASFIIQALPPIICWEIWKTRCANKFEKVKPSPYRTNVNILFTLLQIMRRKFGKANIGETWRSLSNIFYANIHQHISNPVKWIKPPARTFKLNSDGSCLQGSCGGGGLIRDSFGHTIFAYSINLGPGTSNMAEAAALLYGLKWCADKGNVWGKLILCSW